MSASLVRLATEPTVGIAGQAAPAAGNKCQALPDVFRCKSLKTRLRGAKQVSRICDANQPLQLNFYPTMLSSRNRRKPMKIKDGRPCYPTIFPGISAAAFAMAATLL
jgi:hypothetical protein